MDKTKLGKPPAITSLLISEFQKVFGTKKEINLFFSPYRICPLGAHIDHQLGIVMGTTLEEGIYLSFAPNYTGTIRLSSLDYNEYIEFSVKDTIRKTGRWYDYVTGAVYILKKMSGNLRYGFDAVIKASFPGGGLSSSAAIAVAYLMILEKIYHLDISVVENIKLIQELENNYIGLNNGILDQSIILLSGTEKNSLIYLDCKTMEYKKVVPEKDIGIEVVIIYSGVESPLSATGYNTRVQECETAARLLMELAGERCPSIKGRCAQVKLRDISEDIFEKYRDKLPDNLRKRATHFFTEMRRVKEGAVLWEKGDIENFGRLVSESGKSSIENYECGSPPLIKIYDILNSIEGVYGVRFSGAGFRGSCIGIIESSEKVRQEIKEKVARYYLADFPQYEKALQITFCQTNKIPLLLPSTFQ